MSPGANHYETLQVKPFADPATIRGAYRQLARQIHPDVNHAPDTTAQMRELNEAYTVLRDPARRAAYDTARISRAIKDAYVDVPVPTPMMRRVFPSWLPLRAFGVAVCAVGLVGLLWAQHPTPSAESSSVEAPDEELIAEMAEPLDA